MWGNKEDRAARTAAEQWAGAKLVARNMAEGLLEEVCKGWRIPSPKVHIPSPDKKTWTVVAQYPVGNEMMEHTESFDVFPSEEFIATLMMLGLKK